MGTENILDRVEGFSSEFHTRRGRDPSRYYLRVFGDPGRSGTVGLEVRWSPFSLNFLIVDGEVRSTTPRFFGLDPAVTTVSRRCQADPLGGFQSAGRDLVTSLSAEARSAAVLLERAPADIVLGNRSSFEEAATMMKLSEIFRRRPGDEQLIQLLEKGGAAARGRDGIQRGRPRRALADHPAEGSSRF